MTIYWIEDEKDIIEMMEDFLEEEIPNQYQQVKFITHWSKIPILNKDDVIIHDLSGVGKVPEHIDLSKHTTYICSGSMSFYTEDPHIHLRKPFRLEQVMELINKHITPEQGE